MSTTDPLMDCRCPKCGERGQLKISRGLYYRIDHYTFKDGFRHGKYVRVCYFGKTLPPELEALRMGDPATKPDRGPLII